MHSIKKKKFGLKNKNRAVRNEDECWSYLKSVFSRTVCNAEAQRHLISFKRCMGTSIAKWPRRHLR